MAENVKTIVDFVDSYNKLPLEKRKIIDDRLAKANKEKWDKFRSVARGEGFKALPEARQAEKIARFLDIMNGSNKNTNDFTKAITKAMRFVGKAALGPVALLVPERPAGDPDELKKLRNLEAAGFRPTEVGSKRAVPGASKKMGGGKIMKNYAKGGSVRPASY